MTSPQYPSTGGPSLDEAFTADGAVRPLYAGLLAGLARTDLASATGSVAAHLAARGVAFGGDEGWPFQVDPVPRLIEAQEWARVDAGLQRRAATLEAFVADVQGEGKCFSDGVLPASTLDGCPFIEPDLVGLPDPPSARIAVAGMDLVRDADGELLVLEDNCRTPSGMAYALAARDAVRELTGDAIPIRDFRAELQLALTAALGAAMPPDAPEGAETVVLSDGPGNTAWHEHQVLAALAGVDLLVTSEIRLDGTVLRRRDTGAPIGVAYRRTDIDRLRTDDGALTSLGELLLAPLQAGTLSILNGFGTGVADDKLVHAHVDDLTRYYLGEEPLIRSVPTLDLAEAAALDEALDRAAELVFKPRDGHGGHGVVIGPAASQAELDALRADVRRSPAGWIAQNVVALSTHPTVIAGALAPRHVDLRPFALATGPREWRLLPGGLTRVALAEGEMVVNSSRGGGGKDTWVLK
ncbi:MAG: circularly permuted type 2 ATP-grasp protein [Solirubrobacteraceae bacterium]|nr:circularly permuted type 2 ATP-grasp protein [Solirubrobacteraceae bacterium]